MTDCCTFTRSICNNSAQFGALRRIAALSRDQSVTIRRNSARCDGLVHFSGTNMQQFCTIQRAATDCSTFTGSICNNSAQLVAHGRIGALRLDQSVTIRRNSAWYDRLLHFHGINLYQFGAIRRAATDCCIIAGSICNNSAQFGALRPIAALSRVQSVTIQSNSARCNGLVHFCGINLQHFGTIRRAATDCTTFAESICNNSARCNGLLHFHRVKSVTIQRNSARCDGLLHFRRINL